MEVAAFTNGEIVVYENDFFCNNNHTVIILLSE